ncbi:MAG: hypothetical protein R6X32_00475, partial [Chloroflexota bacterium]
LVALLAFEVFNFDTTQFALRDLMGDVRFLGIHWATILAIAFCSIDFAGLVHLFTPENLLEERKEVWYLMGAWLLGATMNAMMTWWAISLTLLNHTLGNEVLSREQLLFYVPIFVAVLVWLTRILFIGAFTVAGNHIFEFEGIREQIGAVGQSVARQSAARQPIRQARPTAMPKREPQPVRALNGRPGLRRVDESIEDEIAEREERPAPQRTSTPPVRSDTNNGPNRSRVRQRPPMPNGPARRMPVHASPRERH